MFVLSPPGYLQGEMKNDAKLCGAQYTFLGSKILPEIHKAQHLLKFLYF